MARAQKKAIREVAISEFKAKCLGLLDQVSKTKTPIRVTRRGKPVADVIPPASEPGEASWMGSLAEVTKIAGDIVSPVIDLDDIEAMKD
jgi:prevent-host-death family protein